MIFGYPLVSSHFQPECLLIKLQPLIIKLQPLIDEKMSGGGTCKCGIKRTTRRRIVFFLQFFFAIFFCNFFWQLFLQFFFGRIGRTGTRIVGGTETKVNFLFFSLL